MYYDKLELEVLKSKFIKDFHIKRSENFENQLPKG